jgi:hypothetical protein
MQKAPLEKPPTALFACLWNKSKYIKAKLGKIKCNIRKLKSKNGIMLSASLWRRRCPSAR